MAPTTDIDRKNHAKALLKHYVIISRKLQDNVLSSKTNTKKQYFKKKLRTNNERVYRLIVAIEELNQKLFPKENVDEENQT